MKKYILALTVLGIFAVAGANAQTTAPTAQKPKKDKDNFKEMDKDNDGKLSKAEVDAGDRKHLQKNFTTIDTNKDMFITKDEIKAYKAAHKDEKENNGKGKAKAVGQTK